MKIKIAKTSKKASALDCSVYSTETTVKQGGSGAQEMMETQGWATNNYIRTVRKQGLFIG